MENILRFKIYFIDFSTSFQNTVKSNVGRWKEKAGRRKLEDGRGSVGRGWGL